MEPPTFGALGAPIPESLWLQHKDVLHRHYILKNQTLKQVKQTMENEHGFPELRLHDYEIALRELLKLRKNLKKEDWYAIGAHISDRNRQQKESEILWNNSTIAARKVRKEVLRNRKLSRVVPRMTRIHELPTGLVIRTPPGSPSVEVAILPPPTGSRLNPTSVGLTSLNGSEVTIHAGPSTRDVQTALREPSQASFSGARALRVDLPFNRFMCLLQNFANSHAFLDIVPTELTRTPEPRLFGYNPSLEVLARITFNLSNQIFVNWRANDSSWFLNWLDLSADFSVLRAFFSFKTPAVCALYENLCRTALILNRSATARVLFEIRDTVSKNNPMNAFAFTFLDIAVRIGSRADGMLEIAKSTVKSYGSMLEDLTFSCRLQDLLIFAAAHRDTTMLGLLVNTVPRLCDNSSSTMGFFAWSSWETLKMSVGIMRQLHAWDPEERETMARYIQLLIQADILSVTLSAQSYPSDRPKAVGPPLTVDEVVMICPPAKRKSLYDAVVQWSHQHRSLVTKAGIFTAALEGVPHLREYIHSCEQNVPSAVCETLQESLLLAASLNDTETVSALLQMDVDPEVGLLANKKRLYHKGVQPLNPMVVAATAGNLETLKLLMERVNLASFLKVAPIYEIVQLRKSFSPPTARWGLDRLEDLHDEYQYSQEGKPDTDFTNGKVFFGNHFERSALHRLHMYRLNPVLSGATSFVAGSRRIDILAWIRNIATAHGVGQSIDKEIIDAALITDYWSPPYNPCDVLLLEGLTDSNLAYHQDDMDLLQLSIRSGCSLKVVEILLSKGMRVHSRPAAQSGNTMLHDVLLGESPDRSKIVELFLQEGADYKCSGEGLTVLEASLLKKRWLPHAAEYIDLFRRLFEAGAPVQHRPRPQLEAWEPLVSLLVEVEAADDLILQVVDAGAGLNEQGWDYYSNKSNKTTLQKAIGRETLARELIRRGADVHAPAALFDGFTALQRACMLGRFSSLSFIKYLVTEQGADVNEAPGQKLGKTALQWAASEGSLSLAEFLLDHGANPNALSGSDRYFLSPFQHHERAFRSRALDFATKDGRLDMVEFLLKAGGRSSANGLGGAIYIAKSFRRLGVLSVLLDWEKEHGSNILAEEVEWQRQNLDAARMHLESCSEDDSSEDDSSEDDSSEDDSSDDELSDKF